MEPFDCGDEPDVGGLIGPGLMRSCDMGMSMGWEVGGGVIRSFFTDMGRRLTAFFGRISVVVDTMLLLLLIFFTLFTLSTGEMGDIGGDALLEAGGHAPNRAG